MNQGDRREGQMFHPREKATGTQTSTVREKKGTERKQQGE